MGLLCAEQNVGNVKNALSIILGLLRAEQNVGNLKMGVQEFRDSCAQNKTSEISKKLHFHKFWHSGAQRGADFGRPPLPPLCGFLCIGSEQSTMS